MFSKVKKGLAQYQNKKVKYFKTCVAVLQFFNEPFIYFKLPMPALQEVKFHWCFNNSFDSKVKNVSGNNRQQ